MTSEKNNLIRPTEEAVDWAVAFIERFENPDEPFTKFIPPKVQENGTIHVGWHDLSPHVREFIDGLYEKGLIIQFDWGAWKAGENYSADPELLAKAPLIDCLKLLTSHVRADRFNEGHFSSVLDNGHITDILRRMREIREAGESLNIQLEKPAL